MNTLLVNQAVNALGQSAGTVRAGFLDTVNDTNTELYTTLTNIGVTVIVAAFLFMAWKKGFAAGAVIGGLLVAAAIYWGINGGLEWIGGQLQQQFGAA